MATGTRGYRRRLRLRVLGASCPESERAARRRPNSQARTPALPRPRPVGSPRPTMLRWPHAVTFLVSRSYHRGTNRSAGGLPIRFVRRHKNPRHSPRPLHYPIPCTPYSSPSPAFGLAHHLRAPPHRRLRPGPMFSLSWRMTTGRSWPLMVRRLLRRIWIGLRGGVFSSIAPIASKSLALLAAHGAAAGHAPDLEQWHSLS